MKTKFAAFRVWPASKDESVAVTAYGRTAREAAEEAFLDFITLWAPPEVINMNCRRELSSAIEVVAVEPARHRPLAPAFQQPELAL